ncbi:hypothetical protein C1I98_18370 [Spongiactinospora gelatinilytica]|uniref:Uncharacterized protein n=1 Tax=Spongiactinospora gelatinilytica TaxID=2666298 RepID=A0A2W2GLG0_9ACTN|nr:hypothetical protein [Spongiactinospora gelatinilytica]PZG43449.1 hypothetical protein C1I98_18370 [Spongiactinospora gelatinilytica]
MPRRIARLAALTATSLACLGTLAVSATPAQARQAAVAEWVASPHSLGDYCHAKISVLSSIGFYNGSLMCYGTNHTGLFRTGSGDPGAACQFLLPHRTIVGYSQGVSQALVCKYSA